jgi:hypothetical protein
MALRRPPGFIEPCQPSTVARPPSGPLWVHEIKHDGYWAGQSTPPRHPAITVINSRRRISSPSKISMRQCTGILRCGTHRLKLKAKQAASSEQFPANQHRTDNAEKHEPNKIHPEDYGVRAAYNEPITASTK